MRSFIWNAKNVAHIAEHGITPGEAEHVVLTGRRTYLTEGKWLARGQTEAGRYIQAIYLLESDVVEIDYSEIDLVALDDADESFYVIHARPLTSAERSSLTRKRKGKGKRK